MRRRASAEGFQDRLSEDDTPRWSVHPKPLEWNGGRCLYISVGKASVCCLVTTFPRNMETESLRCPNRSNGHEEREIPEA